ncbi:uncharacterized protein BDR25DRAFT_306588 [Lindgomyces ingoldianus]|uniref:Uncharacterized protein n=1 Tax=Lindgomyces ingoldianus TaxID=673940 RepID=A0ACB6QEV9_9PLEO|nr:uncharacterized protein BDR25DRAFT_306588 [Lindgomyces ingoldianus]KAF2465431.1 hypothetical protein BDR25DRAFT_306588 [Lindgomyces ingoldianus]
MPKILRLTLFKIPEPAHIEEAVKQYSTLTKDAVKDGNPYISVAQATPTLDEPRNQGFTLVARTVFDSKEDMEYYDTACAAHGEIKALLKGKVAAPPCTLLMDMKE